MSDDITTVELKGLNQLVKALKGRTPYLRVGVMGGGARNSASGSNVTNTEVGAVHEFGAPARNIPQRSFLRVPLIENLEKHLEASGLLDKNALAKVIKTGSIKHWLTQVSIVAESVVDEAFETSGGGKWPPWKDPNYTNEGGMLLVDTGSLRRSITSEVVDAD